jgi:hypothetical protein
MDSSAVFGQGLVYKIDKLQHLSQILQASIAPRTLAPASDHIPIGNRLACPAALGRFGICVYNLLGVWTLRALHTPPRYILEYVHFELVGNQCRLHNYHPSLAVNIRFDSLVPPTFCRLCSIQICSGAHGIGGNVS